MNTTREPGIRALSCGYRSPASMALCILPKHHEGRHKTKDRADQRSIHFARPRLTLELWGGKCDGGWRLLRDGVTVGEAPTGSIGEALQVWSG